MSLPGLILFLTIPMGCLSASQIFGALIQFVMIRHFCSRRAQDGIAEVCISRAGGLSGLSGNDKVVLWDLGKNRSNVAGRD